MIKYPVRRAAAVRPSPTQWARILRRLTPRDRHILQALHTHRVLTTSQIHLLFFTAYSTARNRMHVLEHQLHLVDGFQPFVPVGSAVRHYVLGYLGARLLAAQTGLTAAGYGYRRDHLERIAAWPHPAHRVGVTDIYAALVHTARHSTSCHLEAWWPEEHCTQLWGDIVRPDGYGRWRDGAARVDFFVEYDTGTESLPRVTAKLARYTDLAEHTGTYTPVLFWFPSGHREAHFRDQLPTPPPWLATTSSHQQPDPSGAIWLPGWSPHTRVRLIDLRHTGTLRTDTDPP